MAQTSHPLQHQWVLWEINKLHKGEDYKNSMKEICEFHSIEEFWKNFTFIPKPSALCNIPYILSSRPSTAVTSTTTIPQVGAPGTATTSAITSMNCNIEGICIFKKGIRPEWEDYNNRDGCEIHSKKLISIYDIDQLWENIVYALIGEALDDTSDEICGCRIIERSKKQSQVTSGGNSYQMNQLKQFYRIEIWLRNKHNIEAIERLKDKLYEVLSCGVEMTNKAAKGSIPEFEIKFREM